MGQKSHAARVHGLRVVYQMHYDKKKEEMGKKKKKKRFYRCGFSFIFPFFSSSDSLFSSDFFSIYLRCSNPYCRIPSIRRRSIDCQVSGTNGFFNSRSDFLSLSLPRLSLSLSLHTQICLFAVWLLYRAIDCPPPITAAILNMTILSVHRTQNMNRNSKSPPSTTFQ